MAYNNYNNNYPQYPDNQGWQGAPFVLPPNYVQPQYPQQATPKKKSGAKEVTGKTQNGDNFFGIVAWFSRKGVGLVQVRAFQNSKSTEFETEKGRRGINMMFEVFYKNTGVKRLETACYFYDSGKAFLEKLGIVISTKANNGGYCGYYSKKRTK